MKMRAFALALALLWGVVASGAVRAAEVVILASSVAGFAPGQVLDGAQSVTLPAGGKLTVITGAGEMVSLEGPFSGPPVPAAGGEDHGLVAALSALVGGAERASSLGAVRGGTTAGPDDPWVVDVTRSGDHCVLAAAPVRLWRPDPARQSILSLRGIVTGERSRLDWQGGAAILAWPKEVQLSDGGSYFARLDRAMTAKRLVIHIVPGDLPTDAHRAVWMAQRGCADQAQALLWGMAGK